MYNELFKSRIENRCDQIKDFSERIKFLYDEKSDFISKNRGTEADQIILKFDNLIEKEKSLFELNKTKDNNGEKNPVILIDYSNNSKAERIVFLHELGILDFLEKKIKDEIGYFSANKLAEVISTFTDISRTTAQSYLNPMYSKGIDKSKSPLTKSNLIKVKQKLKDIGFRI